jgi:hypothetical protein
MNDLALFNHLVSQFRSDKLSSRDLSAAFELWCEMDRDELRATLRPYVAVHAKRILNIERKFEPTPMLWAKLLNDANQQISLDTSSASIARRAPDWKTVRMMCARATRIDLAVDLVHGVASNFSITSRGVEHTESSGCYTPQWSRDQAIEVGDEILSAMENEFEVWGGSPRPETAWGWFRALVRTLALSDIDWEEGYIHETYEQGSYYSAVSSAEHSLICEVAAALHPDIPYTSFFNCEVDSPESTMINALVGIVGDFVQTEESNGDISAYISLGHWNARDVLAQFIELAIGLGRDENEAYHTARRTINDYTDGGRYL